VESKEELRVAEGEIEQEEVMTTKKLLPLLVSAMFLLVQYAFQKKGGGKPGV